MVRSDPMKNRLPQFVFSIVNYNCSIATEVYAHGQLPVAVDHSQLRTIASVKYVWWDLLKLNWNVQIQLAGRYHPTRPSQGSTPWRYHPARPSQGSTPWRYHPTRPSQGSTPWAPLARWKCESQIKRLAPATIGRERSTFGMQGNRTACI